MNSELPIKVKICIGRYDFCHPEEKQTTVFISHHVLDKPLNLHVSEEFYDNHHNDNWASIVNDALTEYNAGILYSTNLKVVNELIEQMKDDDFSDSFITAWSEHEIPIIEKRIAELQEKLEMHKRNVKPKEN